ncbi:uncharacterized protein LY89DRAFT_689987 [Mollisia scopiformis]|uniref:Alpha-type protein kinase domain-containing protein n=1 Tax=Mollisia scopiformis TaxID=149040 RepID=A0A132BCQ0_MOLSC|nr:uncharacterized protein LY89DRAFT_689987 [Mollisia scopiformis]KUJ10176.1 hypothetical protein LY89DRAFT_689987 [Mollisia scopiformis]
MASDPPQFASPASVSRSATSRGHIRLLADEMLRASLSSSGASLSSTPAATPPSYRRLPVPPTPAELLSRSRERNPRENWTRLPDDGSVSITRDSISKTKSNGNSRSKIKSENSDSSATTLSADETKARIRGLRRELERARGDVPPRPTTGLFEAACSTDLLFLIDTTGSMYPYIVAAKEQVKSIVVDIKRSFLNQAEVRVAVVSYKDHGDYPNIESLDFTPSTDQVFQFLGQLGASGGRDAPEDVLGGIFQARNLSWQQRTRCIIHIADAPPHGAGELHDLGNGADDYSVPGSEPHGLIYKPLLKELIEFNINYALLRVNSSTDRMAWAFAQVYAASSADAKLLPSNRYFGQVSCTQPEGRNSAWSGATSKKHSDLQFEEMELGTTYSQLRHLVVRTVTSSVSRTAGRMTMALSTVPTPVTTSVSRTAARMSSALSTVPKARVSDLTLIAGEEGIDGSAIKLFLEKDPPQWDTVGWFDETLVVEGFCPDMKLQSANSLNEMMSADENIKLSVAQLTIHARSKPFGEGAVRVASYARTESSTGKFVVKFFKKDGKMLAHLAEDMQIQALCKAFALEFNGLLKEEPQIDFVVTTCLQSKGDAESEGGCLSLEPFIDGEYIKYNNNSMFVKEDSPGEPDPFNQIAQAFSHFTFERSWGYFLVNDLQGVSGLLTDPSIQTRDHDRFKLADTNFHEEGFKFFFAAHKCNSICHELELKSNGEMIISGNYTFRERWPTLEPTVCCSNKLCRRIVRLASTQESEKFRGYHWCSACWPQLQSSMVSWVCEGPGPNHEFDMSRFFYESQGQLAPHRCSEHLAKDKSVSSMAVMGGSLWSKMKAEGSKESISGRSW